MIDTLSILCFFFFQAEDGIRDFHVTGVQTCALPISLVANRWIDFIRCHLSAIGGLSPARKIAATCEMFGVRTAWHGPANVSPIGHAVNMHLDLASINFGIQEQNRFNDVLREVFPGAPEITGGYMYSNDKPGLGVDI